MRGGPGLSYFFLDCSTHTLQVSSFLTCHRQREQKLREQREKQEERMRKYDERMYTDLKKKVRRNIFFKSFPNCLLSIANNNSKLLFVILNSQLCYTVFEFCLLKILQCNVGIPL